MNRSEILEFINEVILEEHGTAVSEDNLLKDCGIDSFGYAILWTSVESKYECKLSKEVMSTVDYDKFTVKDMIDMVVGAKCM
jgi:acyl carrier protein